ncbi:hypothetical protein [Oceanibium sediminis]|uniref:hypothetical protein n=1 Tax=Oceanibium sediminis TaxID=2026339 RepID=UPI000DD357CF|nr:hypothetical protein [Oceanibium sediminis]
MSVSGRFGLGFGERLIGAPGFVLALFFYMTLVAYGLCIAVAHLAPLLRVLQLIGVMSPRYLAVRMWTASGNLHPDRRVAAANLG